ncbi:Glucuronoxylan 4-O-methyltransferase 2 [Apostasia shenzhenica]|uniref:Glucuronoxylan 4-O-methyltransferase 2 n=1 Tax=Apostasia shenzhenica TaxID=1088818 RepID=A0A2I0B9W5_9ASPA|nr:Glucuronoxylan 4-O-methyltransferase 2 [Apostasia shenzhenica]
MPSAKKKLLLLLIIIIFFFFFSSAFFIITLFILRGSTSIKPFYHISRPSCTSGNSSYFSHRLARRSTSREEEPPLTAKELHLLSRVGAGGPSRNLLFFGLNPQFLPLAETTAGAGGSAIFLEDDANRVRRFGSDKSAVHLVKYNGEAAKAYELLRQAREDRSCRRPVGSGSCRLEIAGLPREVREKKWDVVVVDGPRGGRPESPGRMEAIYTAAAVARRGNATDVLVHDVDRMIEKWYSWEFLCHENLLSAKGRLWHFRVEGGREEDEFCPTNRVMIM